MERDIVSFYDSEKVLVTPFSLSDPTLIGTWTIHEDDRVEFSLKAVDVAPTGPQCYWCRRIGHYAPECPDKTNSGVRCYRCGIIGHYATNCFSGGSKGGQDDGGDVDRKGIGSVVCVKNSKDVRRVEAFEDCFILEFDPTQIRDDDDQEKDVSEKSDSVCADEDVSILAEKGQVACRDYPHSRHICATHPFKSTPHELHCKML